ncbi:hypothetical protein TWF173_004848 [Orbilia oligospora]|uniref:SWI5-dependent HO expression protein 3 n=2 Tax=Orbilia oligospora TaxID=2813651 RepID=G1X4U5_ARTOA|nr:hypothetical protein AOL_s00043g719 [Orbilia oligospora ATCC 24927]EGX51985.1 hypothetical protein AOL_s00043g719 [Orbilia oligospora ATCC 24927]KAF3279475.1 hypothetical protein TWF970_004032 [Orbilia oligospora]KAF3314242.1 hypothetical protein TWF173_004848 [Orbilia oligospora]
MTDDSHPNGGVRIDDADFSELDAANGGGPSSNMLLAPGTAGPNGGLSPPGSIGRSAGKSGRVIEKLMAENDRLRRELKSETTKREEEQRRAEAARSSRDSLQSINENLVHQTNIDKTSISRKDRKIEELRSEREENLKKRQDAESNLRKYVVDQDARVAELAKDLSAEVAERERYARQYDVLAASWKHIEDRYQTSVNRLKKRIEEVAAEEKKNKTTVAKLEITIEQQRQEIEKMGAARRKIEQTYNERIDHTEEELKKVKKLTDGESGEVAEKLKEAMEAASQLRHILGVQKAIRGIPDDVTPGKT